MRIAIMIVVFSCFVHGFLFGQKSKDYYSISGLGINLQTVKDEGMSPLLYYGIGLGGNFGFLARNEDRIGRFQLNGGFGGLVTSNFEEDETFAFSSKIESNYSLLFKLNKFNNESFPMFLGGSVHVKTHFCVNPKLGNSATNYAFFGFPAISGRVEHKAMTDSINIDWWIIHIHYVPHPIRFIFQADLPFFAYAVRPGFVTISDIAANERVISFDNSDFVFIDSFKSASAKLEMDYELFNGNLCKVGYLWDMFSYSKDFNPITSGHHLLYIALLFHFN